MVDIRPFRGLRYNLDQVGGLDSVICPPYDIISPSDEQTLLRRSEYGAVRLELREKQPGDPRDPSRYDQVADSFRSWLDSGVLLPEQSPAMYLVEEEFSHKGVIMRRQGLMAAVRLKAFERNTVLAHEFTRPDPKADRLALIRACRANVSPILSMYRDRSGAMAGLLDEARSSQPSVTAALDGQVSYRMWVITDAAFLAGVMETLAPDQIFVADGHHRYEAALEYRDEFEASEAPPSADAASQFVMMTLVSMDDPGLLVLPYHRTVAGLGQNELGLLRRQLRQAFHVAPVELGVASNEGFARAIERLLAEQPEEQVALATLGLEPNRVHLLTPQESDNTISKTTALDRCDTWLLHHKAISPALGTEREGNAVAFSHDAVEAVAAVRNGRAQMAFLLRPLSMKLFEEVVGDGQRLPPKSTYFYPKLPTGLVISHLEGEL